MPVEQQSQADKTSCAKHPSVKKGLPVPFSLQKIIMQNRRFFIKDTLGILKQSQVGFDSPPFHSLFTCAAFPHQMKQDE